MPVGAPQYPSAVAAKRNFLADGDKNSPGMWGRVAVSLRLMEAFLEMNDFYASTILGSLCPCLGYASKRDDIEGHWQRMWC